MTTIAKFISTSLLAATLLTGCGVFRVYTIDLPQGTPITQDVARQVQLGMNQNQVLYILGSPALKDALSPNRWDYIYEYRAGTDGKRAGKPDITNASQYLSVHFNNAGQVVRVDGIETLPTTRH